MKSIRVGDRHINLFLSSLYQIELNKPLPPEIGYGYIVKKQADHGTKYISHYGKKFEEILVYVEDNPSYEIQGSIYIPVPSSRSILQNLCVMKSGVGSYIYYNAGSFLNNSIKAFRTEDMKLHTYSNVDDEGHVKKRFLYFNNNNLEPLKVILPLIKMSNENTSGTFGANMVLHRALCVEHDSIRSRFHGDEEYYDKLRNDEESLKKMLGII